MLLILDVPLTQDSRFRFNGVNASGTARVISRHVSNMKSVFWWRKLEYPEETTDRQQVTDETFHTRPLPSPGIELGPQRCEAKRAKAWWERSHHALAHWATTRPVGVLATVFQRIGPIRWVPSPLHNENHRYATKKPANMLLNQERFLIFTYIINVVTALKSFSLHPVDQGDLRKWCRHHFESYSLISGCLV